MSDGIIEAIRRKDKSKRLIAATQWQPEFHQPGSDTIDDVAVLADFLAAVARTKEGRAEPGTRQEVVPRSFKPDE